MSVGGDAMVDVVASNSKTTWQSEMIFVKILRPVEMTSQIRML